jgi:hypothetical protein
MRSGKVLGMRTLPEGAIDRPQDGPGALAMGDVSPQFQRPHSFLPDYSVVGEF